MTNEQIRKPSVGFWYQCRTKAFWKVMNDTMFVFEMPKVVHIRKPALGLLHRSVQIAILTYFIIFVMWWNKGYQSKDISIGGVTAKVSGINWVEVPDHSNKPTFMIWDRGSYNFRSLQNAGLYLVTRVHEIQVQTLGFCAEVDTLIDARCLRDEHCPAGSSAGLSATDFRGHLATNDDIDLNEDGHGIFTGRCLNETKTCEIYGWCKVAGHSIGNYKTYTNTHVLSPPNVLEEPFSHFVDLNFLYERQKTAYNDDLHNTYFFTEVLNFTILIKNAIEFPYFEVKRRNILPWMTKDYVKQCRYNSEHPQDKYCPVFRISDMFRLAGVHWKQILNFGGVMAITVDWKCNLDWSVEYCLPTYTFRQLDTEYETTDPEFLADTTLDAGSAQQIIVQVESDESLNRYRTLMQVNGITFLIRVTGEAGKFNLLEFTMRFGSGMALLGGATILCDLIVFHFLRDRKHYKEASCDDKTLRRLLKIAAEAQLPQSRRTQLRASLLSQRRRTLEEETNSCLLQVPNEDDLRTSNLNNTNNFSALPQRPKLYSGSSTETTRKKAYTLQIPSRNENSQEFLCPLPTTKATTPSSVTSDFFVPPERINTVESPMFSDE